MTKREFLRTDSALAAGRVRRGAAAGPVTSRTSSGCVRRWRRRRTHWQRDFDLMRASGIHGIIPEIYSGAQALFQSRHLPVRAAVARVRHPDRHRRGTRGPRVDVVHAVLDPGGHEGASGLVQRQREGRIGGRQAGLRPVLQVPRSRAARGARVRARHGARAGRHSRPHGHSPGLHPPSGRDPAVGPLVQVRHRAGQGLSRRTTTATPSTAGARSRRRRASIRSSCPIRKATPRGCSTGSTRSSIW